MGQLKATSELTPAGEGAGTGGRGGDGSKRNVPEEEEKRCGADASRGGRTEAAGEIGTTGRSSVRAGVFGPGRGIGRGGYGMTGGVGFAGGGYGNGNGQRHSTGGGSSGLEKRGGGGEGASKRGKGGWKKDYAVIASMDRKQGASADGAGDGSTR